MFQEMDLPLLPYHCLIKFLKPGIYYPSYFQNLFSEIFNSGFFDPILSDQRIRVVNYAELTAMRERKMCLTCEGKWCIKHECKNSCVVVFNPYDREDESDEGVGDELEIQEEMVEEDVSSDQVDQISEDIDQEMETGFKELNDSMMFDDSFERELELDTRDDDIVEDREEIMKEEAVFINDECFVDQKGEWELGEILEEEVFTFETLTVFDDNSEREKELNFIASGKFFTTDSMTQLKHLKVFDETFEQNEARKAVGMQIEVVEDDYGDQELFASSSIKGKQDLAIVDVAEFDDESGNAEDSENEELNGRIMFSELSEWELTSRVKDTVDICSELVAVEEVENCQKPQNEKEKIHVLYRRNQTEKPLKDVPERLSSSSVENGPDLVPVKRTSWNRALSTRELTSIVVAACVDPPHQQKKSERKGGEPPLPKDQAYQPSNFDKEKAYCQKVSSFEFLEESPPPKKYVTLTMNLQENENPLPYWFSVLRKWLIAKKCNQGGELFGTLSKSFKTPSEFGESTHKHGLESLKLSLLTSLEIQIEFNIRSIYEDDPKEDRFPQPKGKESIEDVGIAVGKLSLAETQVSLGGFSWSPLSPLLDVCGQSAPVKLHDLVSKFFGLSSFVRVGEGIFGEAYRVGEIVYRIVPYGGEFKVNGEVQTRPKKLLKEVVLSCTLNDLRKQDGNVSNACSFTETNETRVCQGPYEDALKRGLYEVPRLKFDPGGKAQ